MLALLSLPMPALQAQQGPLAPALVRSTVNSIADTIAREYFDLPLAERMAAALRASAAAGRYPQTTPRELANALTGDLLQMSNDKHLAVGLVRGASSAAAPAVPREEQVRRSNGGVQRAEILAGNVGYLNLTSFWRPNEAEPAIHAAMDTLARADALIIDMRNNTGGSPDTVAILLGYFFPPGLPLFSVEPRYGEAIRYATSVDRRAADASRPLYVLTAERTFSAGEGLAFLLQQRKRAEIVGGSTAGAANPGRPYPVNETFEVVVPNGRVRSAVDGTNWEGRGVVPDVTVPEGTALEEAHRRALRRLGR